MGRCITSQQCTPHELSTGFPSHVICSLHILTPPCLHAPAFAPAPTHAQATWLAQLLLPHTLRRQACELRPLPPPLAAEVQLPVGMTPYQLEAYKTLLARGYETLADPRPARWAVCGL